MTPIPTEGWWPQAAEQSAPEEPAQTSVSGFKCTICSEPATYFVAGTTSCQTHVDAVLASVSPQLAKERENAKPDLHVPSF